MRWLELKEEEEGMNEWMFCHFEESFETLHWHKKAKNNCMENEFDFLLKLERQA